MDEQAGLPSLEELKAAVERCWPAWSAAEKDQASLDELDGALRPIVEDLLRARASLVGRLPEELIEQVLVDTTGARYLTSWPAGLYRARRFADSGTRTLAELSCGVGGQLMAAASVGLDVVGIERDPLRAMLAGHNLGLFPQVRSEVRCADIHDEPSLTWVIGSADLLFIDPARPAKEQRRTLEALQPDPFALRRRIQELRSDAPPLVIELPPLLDTNQLPDPPLECEYLGLHGRLNRLTVYPEPLRQASTSAVLVGDDGAATARVASAEDAPPSPPPAATDDELRALPFLGMVHPALLRAGLAEHALPQDEQGSTPSWSAIGWPVAQELGPAQLRRAAVCSSLPLPSPWLGPWLRILRRVVSASEKPLPDDAVAQIALALSLEDAAEVTLRLPLPPEESAALHQRLSAHLHGTSPRVLIEAAGSWWVAAPTQQ